MRTISRSKGALLKAAQELTRTDQRDRYKPSTAREKLYEVMKRSRSLFTEIPWIHSVGYGRNPGPTAERRGNEHSDMTFDIAINQRKIRNAYKAAVRHIEKASRQLELADQELEAAIELADQSQESRFLPREYDIPFTEDKENVTDEEKAEADAARDRREVRGEGFGES